MSASNRLRARWLAVLAASAAALAGAALLASRKPADAAGRAMTQPVKVDVAAATRADVPVFLEGIGNVQAFYTVTVSSRIDGEIERVAFTEGQHVRRGDLLAQIDPRPNRAALEQALATRARDAAQLANARRDLTRYTQLMPQDLASKQTVDTQRATVDQLEAQLKIDNAVIDNARTQLDYTRITSPIDGRTGIRLIDPGNIVHANSTAGIVVVTQTQPIAVVFTLPESELPVVKAALAAGPVAVTTLAREGGQVLGAGTLALIDNQIDPASGTIRLKATFPNERELLWPGQFVNARVRVGTDRAALVVPTTAVQTGPDGAFAYVVRPDSTVEARRLEIGTQNDAVSVIKSGLAPGDRVVTSNHYRLQPGARVVVAASGA